MLAAAGGQGKGRLAFRPMSSAATIVTRFAPSPSGHLHVGGARTALFCWAYAKGRGGRFLLRIEDTDQKRSSDAASLGFLKDLKWLGIGWDEGPAFEGCGGGPNGPYFQSERVDTYNRYLKQLVDAGKAYFAFDTAEELERKRAAAKAAASGDRLGGVCAGAGAARLGGRPTLTSRTAMPRVIVTSRLFTPSPAGPATVGGDTTARKPPRSMPRNA